MSTFFTLTPSPIPFLYSVLLRVFFIHAKMKMSTYQPSKRSGFAHPMTISDVRQAEYLTLKKQLPLFENTNGMNGLVVFRDPAFGENKNVPLHRWVPWIAGYSATFVDGVLSAYLGNRKDALVLDPFCGVGTTLLQAVLRGYDAIGFEINPYPALAAQAKLSALTLDLNELDSVLLSMREASAGWQRGHLPEGIHPPPFKSRLPFFSPKVEKQMLHALRFINRIESKPISSLFRTAFGAVMVSFSNYSYEPSLGSRVAAGKPLVEDADVARILMDKLSQIRTDTAWIQEETKGNRLGKGRVVHSNFFEVDGNLKADSIDLMVTSPPYMNNYHYVRNTRPQLYWLNFISSPADQKRMETGNFGQYWQVVRNAPPVGLKFELPELEKTLKELRGKRPERGSYAGAGSANYVASYFNDCFRLMSSLKRALTRHGVAVIVIGNSVIQGLDIRTEQILADIGSMQGLILEGIDCIREKRVGTSIVNSSVRQGDGTKAVLSESAVVLRNP
jgi:DNA modification methylase